MKQQITQYLFQPYFQAVTDENLDKFVETESFYCSYKLISLSRAQNYTRIYVNLIESILECLIDGRQSDLSDLSCLHLLLYPLEHSDYEVSQRLYFEHVRQQSVI